MRVRPGRCRSSEITPDKVNGDLSPGRETVPTYQQDVGVAQRQGHPGRAAPAEVQPDRKEPGGESGAEKQHAYDHHPGPDRYPAGVPAAEHGGHPREQPFGRLRPVLAIKSDVTTSNDAESAR